MQGTAILPGRSQCNAALTGLCVLAALMALLPPACVLLAPLIPLLSAPLLRDRRRWAAWAASAAPAAVSLAAGMDPLYSLSLALPGMLPLLAAEWLSGRKKLGAPSSAACFMGAYALAVIAVAAAASRALGTGVSEGLARLLAEGVAASDQPGELLYRFAIAGLAAVPEGYGIGLSLLDAVAVRQMLLSLQLNARLALDQALPWLAVQVCLLGGLFTALRVQRFHCAMIVVSADPEHPGSRKTRVMQPPGFRMLVMPARLRWALCLMALAALFMMGAPDAVTSTVGQLCYTAFSCAFELAGASVLVCMLSARSPDRAALYGALSAALYALFPTALFFIGLADQALHFRAGLLKNTDSHKEG